MDTIARIKEKALHESEEGLRGILDSAQMGDWEMNIPKSQPEKIIVVEDSLLQGRILVDLLTEHNFEVTLAESGEIALQKLNAASYDLMLMDMVLPDFTGIQLIKKIKQVPHLADIPIIVLSGLTDKENIIESLKMGIHDYITKPYHPKELINRVNIHLKLQRIHKKLLQANAANDKFLTVLGHDLKGAFTNLYSTISLLERDKGELPQITLLQSAKDSTLRISNLLDELLVWGRAVNKGIVQKIERFDLNQFARVVTYKFETMSGKGIELINQIDGEASFVQADKNMMEATLRNILSNAIKFTPPLGTITISTGQEQDQGKEYYTISVEDSGIGMSGDDLDGVLNRGGHSVERDTEGNMGFGLGLQIASEFMKQNGGKIRIRSKRGSGSRFTLLVPAVQ